jgi:hypothetical protein
MKLKAIKVGAKSYDQTKNSKSYHEEENLACFSFIR